jgi:putative endopeptidase
VSTPAFDFTNFDFNTPATQDLFRHVNGSWVDRAEIPSDLPSWGAFQELRLASEKAVGDIITGLQPDGDPDSETSKIANLYGSFMDEETIEKHGIGPVKRLMNPGLMLADTRELALFWGWSARHGIGGAFSLDRDSDPGDPKRYLLFFYQGGLGLPDEEYYRLDQHAEIREKYLAHIERMFTLFELDDPAQRAQAVFDLETKIAACHWDKVRTRDMVEMYHLQSWQDFTAQTPQLHWDAFLKGARLPESAVAELVNAQRTFFTDLAPLVTDENLAAWRSWCALRVINAFASYSTKEVVEAQFDFYGRTLHGIPVLKERWKRGVALAEGVMGEAIGKIYVAKHFPPAVKAQADELVANLLEAYRRSITDLDWMGEETRTEALKKLASFRPKIGYPSRWRDYSALKIVPDNLVENLLEANAFEMDYNIEELSKPVDPEEWLMFPQTVNAYYHPLRNEIVFPAAILQPPFFNPDADDAVNYGGIGAVIGHEIGHGFDDQGSTADGEGRLRDWWTPADREAFKARTQALVAQYSALSPVDAPDVKVNGELTLGENIGDLGGLSIAYQAWLISQENRTPVEDRTLVEGRGTSVSKPSSQESIPDYTPAQRFFLNWAAVWRDKSRPESMRERVATDPHSPDEIRANQTAKNVPAFHEAFGTKPGDAMWLDPQDRVKIW